MNVYFGVVELYCVIVRDVSNSTSSGIVNERLKQQYANDDAFVREAL